MNIFQIALLGIIATLLIVLVKKYNPEYQVLVSLATGVIIFFCILSYLEPVLSSFQDLWNKTDVDIRYFEIILKVVVVS